jgi:nucleoside-diphosphate-sugar epimerase
MILVTGGTGLVGAHLLYQLTLKESKIKAIYRTKGKIGKTKHVFSYYTDDVEPLFNKIEWIEADILNIPKLTDAFKDVTKVYHSAALVSFDPNDYYKLRKTNIEGTANIVNLCLANNIEKLCYVSSIATLSKPEDNSLITEENYWNPETNNSVYGITKYGAEMEVWRATQEGLKAVIVNPGIILGAGFWNEGSGSLFKLVKNRLKYYTNGIAGYINVKDISKCMIQLMESNINNQRYVLVADNLSFKDFFSELAKNLKANAPKTEAKNWMLQILWRLDWLKHLVTKKPRKITKQNVDSLLSKRLFSSEKIKTDLGFEFKTIQETLQEVSQLFLNDQET